MTVSAIMRIFLWRSDNSATHKANCDTLGFTLARMRNCLRPSVTHLCVAISTSYITLIKFCTICSRRQKFYKLQRGRHDCDKMDIDDVDLSFVQNTIDKADGHTEIKFYFFAFAGGISLPTFITANKTNSLNLMT